MTSTIRHIVVLPRNVAGEGSTHFQGFSSALAPDYIQIFDRLIDFPKDIMEPWLDSDQFAMSKMLGSSLDIYMVRVDLIDSDHIDFDRDFNVLWSTETDVDEVSARLGQFQIKPVHISTKWRVGVIPLDELTTDNINNALESMLGRAGEQSHQFKELYTELKKSGIRNRNHGGLSFSPKSHNCTMPLLHLIRSMGYRLDNSSMIRASGDIAPYIEGILELVRFIDSKKTKLGNYTELRKNDALIFCPSIYAHLYKTDGKLWNKLNREMDADKRSVIKASIVKNKGYGNSNLQLREDMFNPLEGLVGALLTERAMELQLFTSAISIAATNQMIPAIRLPHGAMLHHNILNDIYALVNSSRRDRKEKLNKKIIEYGNLLKTDIGSDLIQASFHSRERILAVCDFPLEWLTVDGTALMFSHEISRIPSTPGSVTMSALLSGQRMSYPLSLFMKVLIIRSFKPNDPIKNHLAVAVEGFSELAGLKNLDIKWVDVECEQELVEALNDFDGMMVIFDCHGNHGGEEGSAWLDIGNEQVTVWELGSATRVPPIVILAACSTHPLGGSHASVANAFLKAGVKSIIGTFAPVDAVHTGVTIARILFRMSKFLPVRTQIGPYSWRKAISGFFRMSYVTDIHRDLCLDAKILTEEQIQNLGSEANYWINSEDPDWLLKVKIAIQDAANIGDDDFMSVWTTRNQFVDTMLLVQLGHPEDIMIYNDLDKSAAGKGAKINPGL